MDRLDALHGFRAREKNLSLELLNHVSPDLWFDGDAHRIMQVLHNLVGNALKFTHEGSVVVEAARSASDELILTVTDSGIGMTADQTETVFDEFSQADSSTSRQFGGTGLGLAITRSLVKIMDGEITIDSAKGKGTVVSISIPTPATAPPPVSETRHHEDTLPAGLRILVADDNATNRMLIEILLHKIGAEVEIVPDGVSAVAAASTGDFDLILMDISMPGMDGLEALRLIRDAQHCARRPCVPALAVTANAMRHQVEDYLANGFDGHVAKPIQREDLFNKIGQTIGRSAPV